MAKLNVEAALIAHLRRRGFEAFGGIPDGEKVAKPARFCVVSRPNGQTSPLMDWPSVTVDCHAKTPYLASELALQVDAEMPGFVEVPEVMRVSDGAIQNYSDVMDGTGGMYRLSYTITTFAG